MKMSAVTVPMCQATLVRNKPCSRASVKGGTYCNQHLRLMGENTNEARLVVHHIYEKNINGIIYFTDMYQNLFHIADIIARVQNPRRIGYWVEDEPQQLRVVFCQQI